MALKITLLSQRINASKTNVTSALIPGEKHQAVLLDGSDTTVLCSSQKSRVPRKSKAGPIVPVLHSLVCNPVFGCGLKYRCVQKARSTRQCCARFCSMGAKRSQGEWPTKGCWQCLKPTAFAALYTLTAELRRSLCPISTPAHLVQRKLRWFAHATICPHRELIRGLPLPGSQLKTWTTTLTEPVEPLPGLLVFGCARKRKDWVKVSSELAQDHQAWTTSIRFAVSSFNGAGSIRPG